MYTIKDCMKDYKLKVKDVARLLDKSIQATSNYISRNSDKELSLDIRKKLTNEEVIFFPKKNIHYLNLLKVVIKYSDKIDKQSLNEITEYLEAL